MVTRRQLLKRAGLGAAAWPLLAQQRAVHAAGGPPLRFIVFPLLNGAEPQYFWPNPGNLAAMSTVMEPLKAYQRQITFVRGINVEGAFNHQAVRSIFTGATIPDYLTADPTVKSVDQVVASHFAATAPSKIPSLHLGAIPAQSIEFYQRYGRSTFFFSPKPVDYEANPVTAYDTIFGGGGKPPGPPDPNAPVMTNFENDVLDITDAEIGELATRVGGPTAAQRRKLDEHRESLKSLRTVKIPDPSMPDPPKPTESKCDGAAPDSVTKLRAALQGKPRSAYQFSLYNDIFDAQIDILTRAVVCGITRVATLQAGWADGDVPDPVGPGGLAHHSTSHGDQATFAKCQNWYVSKLLRMWKALDVPDPLDPGGKTVLHNSIILVMSECLPKGHDSNSVPIFLGGNGGGALKAGGYVDLKGASNKPLMQTILQLLGVSASAAPHFGSATYSELRA